MYTRGNYHVVAEYVRFNPLAGKNETLHRRMDFAKLDEALTYARRMKHEEGTLSVVCYETYTAKRFFSIEPKMPETGKNGRAAKEGYDPQRELNML